MEISALQNARKDYLPKLPDSLSNSLNEISLQFGDPTESVADQEELKALFPKTYGKPIVTFAKGSNGTALNAPLTVGVILSGGQAPGGHNVISGLYDGLKKGNPSSTLYGFLGGPSGLVKNSYIEITATLIDEYRNSGGFDIIGADRTKIETPEQFAAALEVSKNLKLNAIVIIGGDDSNTNAAVLAEYFLEQGVGIQVIGCPKTIDGDLKNEYIEASFGFDTACKIYSELIGNIERDVLSNKKYWFFIKLMGRAASHIALECALQTHPNVCLISEEVAEKKQSLSQITDQICDAIVQRGNKKEDYGVVLIPEGLVEFVPEIKRLIQELNDFVAKKDEKEFPQLENLEDQLAWLQNRLSESSYNLIKSFPSDIAKQLLMDRDPHGNVQVSRIETEKLLIGIVEEKLKHLKKEGAYQGSFSAIPAFYGYEGRCGIPSNFDADYCYSLGFSIFVLIASGLTGYIATIRNLANPASEWIPGGIPLTMMLNLEQRRGDKKPVIKKAVVDLDGLPFRTFAENRNAWAVATSYVFPGAIQYFGPSEVCNQPTITLRLEHQ